MTFKCHGCDRGIRVKGEPPAGARLNVACPACGAVNRVTTPSTPRVQTADNNDVVRRFQDFVNRLAQGAK